MAPIPQPPGSGSVIRAGSTTARRSTPCGRRSVTDIRRPRPDAVCGYNPPDTPCRVPAPEPEQGWRRRHGRDRRSARRVRVAHAVRRCAQVLRDQRPGHPFLASKYLQLLPPKFDRLKECDASGWSGEQTLDIEAVHEPHRAPTSSTSARRLASTPCSTACARSSTTDSPTSSRTLCATPAARPLRRLCDAALVRRQHPVRCAAGTGISVLVRAATTATSSRRSAISVPDYPASEPVDHLGRRHEAAGRLARADTHLGELGLVDGPQLPLQRTAIGEPGQQVHRYVAARQLHHVAARAAVRATPTPSPITKGHRADLHLGDACNVPVLRTGPDVARGADISMVGDPATGFLLLIIRSWMTIIDGYVFVRTSVLLLFVLLLFSSALGLSCCGSYWFVRAVRNALILVVFMLAAARSNAFTLPASIHNKHGLLHGAIIITQGPAATAMWAAG